MYYSISIKDLYKVENKVQFKHVFLQFVLDLNYKFDINLILKCFICQQHVLLI